MGLGSVLAVVTAGGDHDDHHEQAAHLGVLTQLRAQASGKRRSTPRSVTLTTVLVGKWLLPQRLHLQDRLRIQRLVARPPLEVALERSRCALEAGEACDRSFEAVGGLAQLRDRADEANAMMLVSVWSGVFERSRIAIIARANR